MAERSNAEKLAAGRRKLKEFQQKCKENSPVMNKKSREILKKEDRTVDGASKSTVHSCQPDKFLPNERQEEKETSLDNGGHQLELNGNGDTHIMIDKKTDVSDPSVIQTAQDAPTIDTENVFDKDRNFHSPQHSLSPEKSSTEALRQLSMQMDGLVADSLLFESDTGAFQLENDQKNGMEIELQNRNQELAGLLEEEKRQADALRVQIKECRSRILQLESERESWIAESNVRLERETRPLREQLQLHVQTVGVLVGEKTELSAALSRSQVVAKQKTDLVEDLQTKLRDSQVRVTELARELSTANEDRERLKGLSSKAEADISNLSGRLNQISLQLEERNQEVSEARQKLSIRSNEISALQKELEEVKSKLSLSRLRLRQLTGVVEGAEDDHLGLNGNDEAAESWHQHRLRLERQNEELHRAAQEAVEEREEASRRFQTYIHTLNSQMEALARKVESLTSENKTLSEREQSLVRHLSELEKQIQKSSIKSSAKEEEDTAAKMSLLEEKYVVLQEQLHKKIEEFESLNTKLKDSELKLQEVETELESERRRKIERETIEEEESRHERERLLLAAMESDKVAASRAVDQNLKLKAQLAELQDAFVKLSNDKLVLTESLNNEQHLAKEQAEKLLDLEEQIHHLRIKQGKENVEDQMDQKSKEAAATLETKVNLLQLERDRLLEELKGFRDSEGKDASSDLQLGHSEELGSKEKISEDVENSSEGLGKPLSESEAVQKLEERFRCTMEELAALTEEKQRLEHLVLQLQGETETIGEYVALYQTQRGLLRKRAREKDEQLRKLSKDREELRSKLTTLESLVRKLVHEEETNDKQNIVTELAEEPKESIEEFNLPKEDGPTNTDPVKDKTAGQIMALLAEIGSNSSLSTASIPSTFHPCPWCSGQLLTV